MNSNQDKSISSVKRVCYSCGTDLSSWWMTTWWSDETGEPVGPYCQDCLNKARQTYRERMATMFLTPEKMLKRWAERNVPDDPFAVASREIRIARKIIRATWKEDMGSIRPRRAITLLNKMFAYIRTVLEIGEEE